MLIEAGPGLIGSAIGFNVKLPAPSGSVQVLAGPIGPEQLASGIHPALTFAAKVPELTVMGLVPEPVIFVLAPRVTLDGVTELILASPPQSLQLSAKFVNGAADFEELQYDGGFASQHPHDF